MGKELKYLFTKLAEIWIGSDIRDQEKTTDPGSRWQEAPDPDPQHWFLDIAIDFLCCSLSGFPFFRMFKQRIGFFMQHRFFAMERPKMICKSQSQPLSNCAGFKNL
jgi:hypothetical protein